MDVNEYEIYDIIIVPLVIGIATALKRAGLSSKYIPVFNALLGLILGIIFNPNQLVRGLVVGTALGLSASGLYDVSKKPIETIKVKLGASK